MRRSYIVRTKTIGEVEFYPMTSKSAWKSVAFATVDGVTFIRTKTGRVFSSFCRSGGVYLPRCEPRQEATILDGLMLVGAIDKDAYAKRSKDLRAHAEKIEAARDAEYGSTMMTKIPGFKFTASQKRLLAAIQKAEGQDNG